VLQLAQRTQGWSTASAVQLRAGIETGFSR
jgi:hypothetical protein